MPWIKGQTKPMANAATTGPRKSQHQRRVEAVSALPPEDFFRFKMNNSLYSE